VGKILSQILRLTSNYIRYFSISLAFLYEQELVDNDNEVYFTLVTSNSQIDKYRTVVETHIKTTKFNVKKKIRKYVRMVKFVVSWVLLGNYLMRV